ncbi:hydantoinase/carbamoylase family amidase [Endozoicomonas sp. SCSIO W0465]|uniref:hydantoinase/carbamoylase family amidase n=1 Tax=Endozoicomonas sp. SCSIO W0465 TaxID=2918516 RepID=UPI002076522E|nr:hydantoinase/carbamoylase family amidase [Endozoicomonas sp. SCSIO W0465]USE38431.1 hydantoinase/carbamoylase family amidase [Endozoicomonas sp. SCSIO W0465]
MKSVSINSDRLLSDLYELRKFGQYKTGVIRQMYSRADMESRQWLRERMTRAGLDARIDGLGNVIGYSGKSARTLLMGSHTDTQPIGGWLDGAYGVICALEVYRALAENPDTAQMSLDIASWADEENTFHGFLGCKGFLGQLPPQVINTAIRADGLRLKDALHAAGLNGISEQYEPERYLAYLSTHIEQGPRLDISQKQIGIVNRISGCREFAISFFGESNHAGSTPMAMRRDAGMALMEFATTLNRRFRQTGTKQSVWTIGHAEFDPGAASVIPGKATMTLQFRDPSPAQMDRLEQALWQMANALQKDLKVDIQIEKETDIPPVRLDGKVQEVLCHIAQQHCPDNWQVMSSGAINDNVIFSRVMPSGMLLVPSIGGISYSFDEDTNEEDLITGCEVLANAAAEIIRQAS